MTITAETLDRVRYQLSDAVEFSDLVRFDWRRQTDAVKVAFVAARLFADTGSNAVFVDGRIATKLIAEAVASGNVKAFFNRRCHDRGLSMRRVLLFDAVKTTGRGRKSSGKMHLHFHGILGLPRGWTLDAMKQRLEAVFGRAATLGQRQFHIAKPDWTKHCSHNGVQVKGPLGKVAYALSHAGPTYNALDLNEGGKRSRKAPTCRGAYNKNGKRLAQGIPSNFLAKITLYDRLSGQLAREAFAAWVAAERKPAHPSATRPTPLPQLKKESA